MKYLSLVALCFFIFANHISPITSNKRKKKRLFVVVAYFKIYSTTFIFFSNVHSLRTHNVRSPSRRYVSDLV